MAEQTKQVTDEKETINETKPEKDTVKENGAKDEKEVTNNNKEEKDEKEKTENEDEEGSDEESSDEEELGLLERPVEILDRKRERKSTDRLKLEKYTPKKTEKEELDYEKGKGKKLGDIPYVKHMVDKTLSDDLKPMHRLLFFRQGKSTMVKKTVRTFCGYPFEKDSKHYEKVDNMLDKLLMVNIRMICGVLGLEKNGDKAVVKERLMEFLMEPKDLEKPIPGKKTKPKKTPSKKKKTPKKDKKPSEKKAAKSVEEVSSASDSDSDKEDEEENKDTEKSKEKKKASPKKKKPETEKKKKTETKKKASKQPTIKLPSPKKKKSVSPKKRKAEDNSDDDDEPLLKKAKESTGPSDAELKKVVSSILQGADLEHLTMKTVVKQVFEKYPNVNLDQRKDFIKSTVKEIIS